MKTVLITGATGFIGRHSIGPLLARGYAVHTVSAHESAVPAGVQHHVCDLLDGAATEKMVVAIRPSSLLHLAWYAAPGAYWTAEENLRWLEASLVLARAFRRHGGQRLVGAGSCAEYDWDRSGPCVEAEPPVPATLYGRCKQALHQTLTAWGDQYGVSAAWARIFFLYGPHEHPDRLVPSVIRAGLERREVNCTSGTQVRDFQHVADTAGAIVALLDSKVRGPVNIASGRPNAIKDVIAAIAERLGSQDLVRLGARSMPAGDPKVLVADVRRLREEVGWHDHYDLGSGLDDAIAWWRTRSEQA